MKRKIIIGGIIVAALFSLVYFNCIDHKLDLNGDNVEYMLLARNLSKGYGYVTNSIGVGEEHVNHFAPVNHFPPGYPAILSLFMACGIDSLMFFKVLNGLFFLCALLLLGYVVWKLTDNPWLCLACAVLPIFSPHLQHFAGIVMSEMSYLFFIVLSVFALFKYDKSDKIYWKSPWFYTAIVSAVVCYYIRTVGVSCLFALLIFFLFRKEWKQALTAVGGAVVLLLPWVIRNKVHGLESRYFGTIMTVNPWRPEEGTISSFGEMWEKMWKNFDETVIKGFKEALFPFLQINYDTTSTALEIIGTLLVLSVMVWGAWRLAKWRWWLIAFMVANIGLFMLWHGGNGIRYVVPIIPFIYVCFYSGVYAILELIAKRIKVEKVAYWIPLVFLLMVFPMIAPIKEQAKIVKLPYPPQYQNYFAIARKVERQGAMHGAVVCCRKPGLFEYYAPHSYTTNYLYSQDTFALINDLVQKRVDYVVLEQLGYSSTGLYLYPAIMDHAELFSVALHMENPDTYLLQFDRQRAEEKIKEHGWKYIK